MEGQNCAKAAVLWRENFSEPHEVAGVDSDEAAELQHRPVANGGDDDECDGEDGAGGE